MMRESRGAAALPRLKTRPSRLQALSGLPAPAPTTMNTNTLAAHAGRLAGHVWLALQQIDWAEVGRIVLHGLVAAAVLTYLAGHALGTAVHRTNDWLSARWVALLVRPEAATEESSAHEPEAPAPVPAPPAVQPLYTELAHLSVSKLRTIAGTRSKRFRRTELLAMVAA